MPRPERRQSFGSLPLRARTSWKDGTGTNRFLRWQRPCLRHCPSRCPSRGWRGRGRARSARRSGGRCPRARPQSRPACRLRWRYRRPPCGGRLQRTRTRCGAPGRRTRRSRPRRHLAGPMSGCGKVTARYLSLVTTPRTRGGLLEVHLDLAREPARHRETLGVNAVALPVHLIPTAAGIAP